MANIGVLNQAQMCIQAQLVKTAIQSLLVLWINPLLGYRRSLTSIATPVVLFLFLLVEVFNGSGINVSPTLLAVHRIRPRHHVQVTGSKKLVDVSFNSSSMMNQTSQVQNRSIWLPTCSSTASGNIKRRKKEIDWVASDGLPSLNCFPSHINDFISILKWNFGFLRHCDGTVFHRWPESFRNIFNKTDPAVLIAYEFGRLRLQFSRSNIPGVSLGVFPCWKLGEAEIIAFFSGNLSYANIETGPRKSV